jgi:hypothetical protein
MKIHVFPLSGRVVGIVALKNYLALDCELKPLDLGRGDQRAPEYVSLNPNRKTPTLEDDGIVRWESNQSTSVRIVSPEGIAVLPPSELGSERRAERAQERMDRARQQRNRPVSTALNGILIRAEDGIYYEDNGHKVDDTSWFGELPSVFRAPTSSPYAACLACDCRFSHVS